MATKNSKIKTLLNKPYKFGSFNQENINFRTPKGLNSQIIQTISQQKNEPRWMLDRRLKALDIFFEKTMPSWGPDLSDIDFQDLTYFIRAQEKTERRWSDVPAEIQDTFNYLGIPEAEKKYLAGVGAQYESEAVYHNLKTEWTDKGVIFCDTDTALKEYPEIVKKYFGTIVPAHDNKFAALNTACWSGGSFVYVPKGVKLEIPIQAYFRINAKKSAQFERTLIIAEEDSEVQYVEGCSAPIYSTDSLHAAVVEIVVKKNARVRYTTIQNWSTNVYNLVTKRATVHANASMEWIDGNLGSKVTIKYPSVYLVEPGASGEVLSVAVAGKFQHLDAGAKAFHLAPNTRSKIISKSISHSGGTANFRGQFKIANRAKNSKTYINCDALILDNKSRSDTYPVLSVNNKNVSVEHEAHVSKISEDQLFYLKSRGLSNDEASSMIINGFLSPIVKELPMEYAVEMNRLIEFQMEGNG